MDGSEARGSVNGSVLVKYGTYIGLARFTVWMPEFPLDLSVPDVRLSQIKGWKVPDYHAGVGKSRKKRSTEDNNLPEGLGDQVFEDDIENVLEKPKKKRSFYGDMIPDILELRQKRSKFTVDQDDLENMIPDILERKKRSPEVLQKIISRQKRSYWSPNIPEEYSNGVNERPPCRVRFQQSPVDVYAHFMATDHDSGRVTYFVNRRTWLRVTDLVLPLLRVSDPKIASLHGRILQGRFNGRAEVQVLSPITGRVIGAKEVRVSNDKVTINKLAVRVVSGLQLNISPDNSIENGYIAETSVTRRLTAQYQVRIGVL